MKLKARQALRDLSVPELTTKLTDLRKEYTRSRLLFLTGKLKNPRSLSVGRNAQAKILTIIGEKQKAQV